MSAMSEVDVELRLIGATHGEGAAYSRFVDYFGVPEADVWAELWGGYVATRGDLR